MAGIHITYTCGCGFSTHELEAAIKHSDEKLHTLTVYGEIKAAKRSKTSTVPRELHTHPAVSAGTNFAALRAKLSG